MRPFLLFFGEAFLMLLRMASEIGLIGSMLYFAFLAHVLGRSWRVSIPMDPELRFFANLLLVAFAGVIVNFRALPCTRTHP